MCKKIALLIILATGVLTFAIIASNYSNSKLCYTKPITITAIGRCVKGSHRGKLCLGESNTTHVASSAILHVGMQVTQIKQKVNEPNRFGSYTSLEVANRYGIKQCN